MSGADTDLRRRSAWRLLVPPLAFLMVLAAAVGAHLYDRGPGVGALVLSGGFGLLALWAVYDGLRRATGHPTYLGVGRGLDRLFGLMQLVTTVGMALALLPNTLRLLNFIARLATGTTISAVR